jgi:ribosomal protein S12 methylthiotransferase
MRKEKISVVTLGCSKNMVDSERLMNQIKLNDFRLTENVEDADTVIVNTCGFIEAAKEESIGAILEALKLKKEGTLNKVIVSGCLSQRYKEDLMKELPDVDIFFGTEDYEGIVKEIGGTLRYDLLGERVLSGPSHSAYLKISEGCDNPCSFCAIPLMRGKHHSKDIPSLVREAEFLADNNTKELIIIAQDTTDYGKDIYGERAAAKLIHQLSEIEKIKWIRLMYAYPSHFPDDLIEVIANNPKVLNYIDMPLQHISENCLRSMRRGITKRRTLELLETLKTRIPGLALRTTFIVGYPSETEKDFEELCDFIQEFEFDRLGVFTYSVEDTTPSFILGDPIPAKEKNARKNRLMEIQQEISARKNQALVGAELDVLVDGKEGDLYVARSYRDAPEVDGEVLITSNKKKLKPGDFLRVSITDANEYDLFAELVKK